MSSDQISRRWMGLAILALSLALLLVPRVQAQQPPAEPPTEAETAPEVRLPALQPADVTMTASSLYRRGPDHLASLLDNMRAWMVEHEYASVEQLKGSMSQEHCPDPGGFERVNYMKTLTSWSARTS